MNQITSVKMVTTADFFQHLCGGKRETTNQWMPWRPFSVVAPQRARVVKAIRNQPWTSFTIPHVCRLSKHFSCVVCTSPWLKGAAKAFVVKQKGNPNRNVIQKTLDVSFSLIHKFIVFTCVYDCDLQAFPFIRWAYWQVREEETLFILYSKVFGFHWRDLTDSSWLMLN